MPERRIHCPSCRAYDRDARRCTVGKANPRKKHEAQTLAELLGPQMLCLHSPFRESLLARMYHPRERFVWSEPLTPRLNPRLEVEFIEEEGVEA